MELKINPITFFDLTFFNLFLKKYNNKIIKNTMNKEIICSEEYNLNFETSVLGFQNS
jgi:hypothetical protein